MRGLAHVDALDGYAKVIRDNCVADLMVDASQHEDLFVTQSGGHRYQGEIRLGSCRSLTNRRRRDDPEEFGDPPEVHRARHPIERNAVAVMTLMAWSGRGPVGALRTENLASITTNGPNGEAFAHVRVSSASNEQL
jgi:hypothetical protein